MGRRGQTPAPQCTPRQGRHTPEKGCLATILGQRPGSRDICDWVSDVWVVETGWSTGLQGHSQRQQKKSSEKHYAQQALLPFLAPSPTPFLCLLSSTLLAPYPSPFVGPLSFGRPAYPLMRAWCKANCVALAPFTSPRVAHAPPPLCSGFVPPPAPSLCTRTVQSNVRGIPVPSPPSPSLHLLRGSLWCPGPLLPLGYPTLAPSASFPAFPVLSLHSPSPLMPHGPL